MQDLNDHWIKKRKGKEFGFQLDETTHSNSDAQLLICYVRLIDGNDIVDDLIFCKSILTCSKPCSRSLILISEYNSKWTKCVGVFTDGAHSMSGCYGGLYSVIYRLTLVSYISEAYIEPSFRGCSECSKIYKNYVRIWDRSTPPCCNTAVREALLW